MSPDLMALWPLAAGHWLLLRQATRVSGLLSSINPDDRLHRPTNKGQNPQMPKPRGGEIV